jgi:hypothetical protein
LVSFLFKNSSQGLGLSLTIEGGGGFVDGRLARKEEESWGDGGRERGGGELRRWRSGRRRRGIEKTEAERRDTSGGGRRKMGHTHEQSHDKGSFPWTHTVSLSVPR